MSKKPKNNLAKNMYVPPEPTGPIRLDDEQAAQVRAAEKHVVDSKCRLANLTIQQLQAAQETVTSEQQLIQTISDLAVAHGITKDNAGKWNFDTKGMVFTQTNRPR